MGIACYRDLRVWQEGVDLVVEIYELSRAFPKHETYGLAGQVQRAATSIPSNLAEGHTREHTREYYQHVSVARGSLAEVETQMEIAKRLGYIDEDALQQVLERSQKLGRQLTALRDSLSRRLAREATKNESVPNP